MNHPANTFPCMSCAGTGKYRGVRVNQPETICFACNGVGYRNKPHAVAMAEKQNRKFKQEAGRAKAAASRREAFEAEQPGLLAWMSAQTWSTFLQEMVEKIATPYGLSDRQLEAVLSTRAKQAARDEVRTTERKAAEVKVDLAAIEVLFDKASGSGLKKPTFRAEGLVISKAPSHGKNAGALYVKSNGGEYLGKVAGGVFQPTYAARTQGIGEKLAEVAVDPLEAAIKYGRLTGSCCCCGRELSDPASIAAGIGPICESKWFA